MWGSPQQLNVTHSKEAAQHFEPLSYLLVKRAIPQPAQAIWGPVKNPLLGTAPRWSLVRCRKWVRWGCGVCDGTGGIS